LLGLAGEFIDGNTAAGQQELRLEPPLSEVLLLAHMLERPAPPTGRDLRLPRDPDLLSP
jgi:hypothetical protein